MRTATAAGHRHGRIRPDDGDGVQMRRIERQFVTVILEQHHAFLSQLPRFEPSVCAGMGCAIRG